MNAKIVIIALFFCVVMFLILLLGIGAIESNYPVIGFSMDALSQEERWAYDKGFFIEKAKQLAVIPIIADSKSEPQVNQIRELIKQNVDVIVVIPHDSEELVPIVEEAHLAGIKVVTYARRINSSYVDFHVAFNAVQVGKLQAKGVIDIVKKGNIAYLGGPATDNNSALLKLGMQNFLKDYIGGDINIVFDKSIDNWNSDIAYDEMSHYLRNNTVDGVIAANDGLAAGAIKALAEANLSVPVSGGDADIQACKYIIEGKQASTVYMPIKELAYKAAEISAKLARGEPIEPNTLFDNKNSLLSVYLIDSVLVNRENLNETVIRSGFHSYEEIYKM